MKRIKTCSNCHGLFSKSSETSFKNSDNPIPMQTPKYLKFSILGFLEMKSYILLKVSTFSHICGLISYTEDIYARWREIYLKAEW